MNVYKYEVVEERKVDRRYWGIIREPSEADAKKALYSRYSHGEQNVRLNISLEEVTGIELGSVVPGTVAWDIMDNIF